MTFVWCYSKAQKMKIQKRFSQEFSKMWKLNVPNMKNLDRQNSNSFTLGIIKKTQKRKKNTKKQN